MRLADILKKYKGIKDAAVESKKDIPEQEKYVDNVSLSGIVKKEDLALRSAEAKEAYRKIFKIIKEIYRPEVGESASFQLDINPLIQEIVDILCCGNKDLLEICLTGYNSPEDYFFYHIVNVTVISVELGIGLGYDKLRLRELGNAAFLHDIGICQYFDIINKKGILGKEEFRSVKEHPKRAQEILLKIGKNLSPAVVDVAHQEHERLDGSGYPRGLKEGEISEYSKIIGLADVYEAMIHQRPYRTKYTPLDTIKAILHNKNSFDSSIIKILIERIGIFPLGISVRLNTKEIGVVVKENPKFPLRPVIKIVRDANGTQINEPKQLNLADNSVIFIEECMECVKE